MPLTIILIVITGFISWQAFNQPVLFDRLKHFPYVEAKSKEYHRWITAVFVHADWFHLIINMLVLYGFGSIVEQHFLGQFGEIMGRLNFLAVYLLSGIFANVPTYLKHRDNSMFRSVGASGAVSGMLLASVIFEPWSEWRLYGILPIRAIVAAVLYLIYSSWASRRATDNIDHEAHFWGAVFGFAFTIALKPTLWQQFLDELMRGF